jgi:hypothetical protein
MASGATGDPSNIPTTRGARRKDREEDDHLTDSRSSPSCLRGQADGSDHNGMPDPSMPSRSEPVQGVAGCGLESVTGRNRTPSSHMTAPDPGQGGEGGVVGVGQGVEVLLGGGQLGVAEAVHDGFEVGAASQEPGGVGVA